MRGACSRGVWNGVAEASARARLCEPRAALRRNRRPDSARAHGDDGGRVTRHRPIEALGVFYVLDQMRMYRAMTAATGQVPFLAQWFAGAVPADVMMPADARRETRWPRCARRNSRRRIAAPTTRRLRLARHVAVSGARSIARTSRRRIGRGELSRSVVFYDRDGQLFMCAPDTAPRVIDVGIS